MSDDLLSIYQRGNVVEGKESDLDRDEDGQPAYHTMNMDDHLAEVWENAHAARQEKSLHEMSHSVNTPSLNDLRTAYQTGGSVVAALDGESPREMGVSGIITMKDGTVLVGIAPFTRDRSGERILDEDNAKMIPYEDLAAQNDTFWDGQNQMGVEAEDAMTDTTDENEDTETEEDSANINDSINDNEVTDENQGEEESGTGEPRSNITTDEDGEQAFQPNVL